MPGRASPRTPDVSRAERLLELLQVLRRHRQPVAGEALAAELGVSLLGTRWVSRRAEERLGGAARNALARRRRRVEGARSSAPQGFAPGQAR